jgi:hypothetical protein
MHASNQAKASARSGKRKSKLAKDGQTSGKFFNVVAGRPYPSFSTLEQRIQVVDIYNYSSFITTSTTVPVFTSFAFILSSLPNYTSYTSLFDQYRVDQLEVWLEPSSVLSTANYSTLATAIDLDDANVATAYSQVEGKQGALVGEGAAGRYHRWRPHVAIAEFSGAFTSYGNAPAGWIDAASPSVQHFGFKTAAGITSSGAVSYNLTVRAVVSWRAPGV